MWQSWFNYLVWVLQEVILRSLDHYLKNPIYLQNKKWPKYYVNSDFLCYEADCVSEGKVVVNWMMIFLSEIFHYLWNL